MDKKIFADGMRVKRNDKAPEFIIGNLSIKVDEFIEFLRKNEKNGWVNVDLKKSKEGKYYAELNTWEKGEKKVATEEKVNPEDIPF